MEHTPETSADPWGEHLWLPGWKGLSRLVPVWYAGGRKDVWRKGQLIVENLDVSTSDDLNTSSSAVLEIFHKVYIM